MDYDKLYSELLKPLTVKYGELDEETLSSIIGFSAGGPVSMSTIESIGLYVTCELSTYDEQIKSSEKLNFEFFSKGNISGELCRSIFTALGNLSFNTELGNKHTIGVNGVTGDMEGIETVKLKLFSKTKIGNGLYGLYEVLPV